MRKTIVIFLLTFISTLSFSNDLADGNAALERKDYNLALQKFKSSAEQGNPNANIKLGNMYDGGLGVSQDLKEAIRYYKIAARQGHPLGFIFVGAMYENGQGVERNLREAARWKNLAKQCASQNMKNCQNLDQ
jgi:TPR repeat protein